MDTQFSTVQPVIRKLAPVVVMPRRVSRPPVPTCDDALLETVSLHLFGAFSLCCSVEERQAMQRHLAAMLAELDEVRHVG
jgi:hypothetical protein